MSAHSYAAKLRLNAVAGLALIGVVYFSAPVFIEFQKPQSLLLWSAFALAAAAALALSVYLLLDALLFRLLSSYENEEAGCIAVDRFLARAGLRRLPQASRPLHERMAGTNRLLNCQRAALLVFLALFVFMAAA